MVVENHHFWEQLRVADSPDGTADTADWVGLATSEDGDSAQLRRIGFGLLARRRLRFLLFQTLEMGKERRHFERYFLRCRQQQWRFTV